MFLYNITINIDKSILDEWISWMKDKHIPALRATEIFENIKLFRLTNEQYNEGVTFSLQLFSAQMHGIVAYETEYARRFEEVQVNLFKDKALTFQTLLEQVI